MVHTRAAGAAVIVALMAASGSAVAKRAPIEKDDEAAILHVLNRIGYGPRLGDVEKVRRMGLREYIEAQLSPDRIADSALLARLQPLTTLSKSSREIAEQYERPALEARRQRQREAAVNPDAGRSPGADPGLGLGRRADMDPQRRLGAVPLLELSEQKILRAVYSERQLEAVLTDFWFNHFNVDARKGPGRFLLTEYERDAVRPHVLGNFRELLEATAKSPAMLFYLDNWMSADPDGPHFGARRAAGRGQRLGPRGIGAPRGLGRDVTPEMMERMEQRLNMPRGLNENYGRELLELHTLGVDGGYTQKDVTEVARAFTGWSIEGPRRGGGYVFRPQMHDAGAKVVLGQRITAGGEGDGEQVLDILATHPSTARFIATKLARRFVSDTPPAALVDRVAATFTRTKGDLRKVTATLLTSPEFLSPDAYGAKVKTPFEFIVSALRATGADVAGGRALVRSLQELGMPLYQCQPPTGYKDTDDAWVNTGAIVNRMNHALALASGTIPGVSMITAPSPDAVLPGAASEATRATIAKARTAAQALALALGSPEFQRR
jgi:uncharacterized protein (DUF1800 family)